MRFNEKSLCTSLLIAMTACTVQQQNGNDIRLADPSLFNEQRWQITQQVTTADHDRICTVSAGELAVTQRMHDHIISVQVGTSNNLAPGDSYKVLAGAHNYETLEAWFDAADSQAIIKDLMSNDPIYTETREGTIEYYHSGPVWRSVDNVIPTAGFPAQYKLCTHFVKAAH